MNVRSLSKHYDQLTHYLSSLKHEFSIIALSETWLSDDSVNYYDISHYNMAPQGSVISPVLFTLYTDDCRSSDPEMLYIKYSDDRVIIDTTNSNNRISKEIHNFAGWCENYYLDLNPSKTKEMLGDFRCDQPTAPGSGGKWPDNRAH